MKTKLLRTIIVVLVLLVTITIMSLAAPRDIPDMLDQPRVREVWWNAVKIKMLWSA